MPSRRSPRHHAYADLTAFLAVLAATTVLILVGHLSAPAVASIGTAVVTLFGAWLNRRQ